MTASWDAERFPPLAATAFDLDIDEPSFPVLARMLADHPDIVGVRPVEREAPAVVVHQPDAVGHVLGRNYLNYAKGVGTERVRLLLGRGLIVSEGEFWRDHRRMMQPAFHRNVLARLAALMAERNAALLERWRTRADAGEAIDLTADLARVTLEIVLHSLFGDDLDELVAREGDIPFAFLAEEPSRDLRTVQLFLRPRRLIREVVKRRRRSGGERTDLIGMLMAARHPESGEPMSDRELVDEVTTLVVAGHETTAASLGWAWYLLSQNPESEAALHGEIDALPDRPPGFDDLGSLAFTRRVIDETLRLYPPGWLLTRRALAADRIGDYEIPAGTEVLVSPYFLHRRPDLWPQPERFDPGRFGAGGERHRFAYIPFGAGPRRCIGDNFALVEMQIHLALLARQLRLRYLGESPPELEPRINLRPREPLRFAVERR